MNPRIIRATQEEQSRQHYADGAPVPAVKLPAGALVVKMKNPAETSRMFKITFQSLVGFLNITGGMNGLTPLEQNFEKVGSGSVFTSEYLPPKGGAKNEAAIHIKPDFALARNNLTYAMQQKQKK